MGPSQECNLEFSSSNPSALTSSCTIIQPSGRRMLEEQDPDSLTAFNVTEFIATTRAEATALVEKMRDHLFEAFEKRIAKLEEDHAQLKAQLKAQLTA